MASRRYRNNHKNTTSTINMQTQFAKPLLGLVILLILCNLITLYFLHKSAARTASMDCPNIDVVQFHHPPLLKNNDRSSSPHNFPNLLESNSPYSHLPYLPHNLNHWNAPNHHTLYTPNHSSSLSSPATAAVASEMISNSDSFPKVQSINDDGVRIQNIENYKISKSRIDAVSSPSITVHDELQRNGISTNQQLWNWKDTESQHDIECDDTMEHLLNQSIYTLHRLKGRNYMESSLCPNIAKLGWRHGDYVPFVFGNHCEPWWARDAIFIISRLINKEMIGIEWGTGGSSLWLAMLSKFTIAMEHDKLWQRGVMNITQTLGIDNLQVIQENMGRRYCELDLTGILDKQLGGRKWEKGKIDFFSLDGRLRYPATEWMLDWVKPHGGIVIFDNSDRVEGHGGKYGQENATELIPKHWLRFDSSFFAQHVEPIKDKRWLQNSMTTIWITRDPKCAEGRFDLNPKGNEQALGERGDFKSNPSQHDTVDDDGEVLNFRPF